MSVSVTRRLRTRPVRRTAEADSRPRHAVAVRGDGRRHHRRRRLRLGHIRRGGGRWKRYFRGVLLVPERELFVARLNGDIVGSAILVRPPRNNEAQAFAATPDAFLHRALCPRPRLGPPADRGRRGTRPRTRLPHPEPGRARDARRRRSGCIESMGYIRWGEHPEYALVRGKSMAGLLLLQAAAAARKPATANDRADHLSGDRPEGRSVRPAAPRRHGPGDGLCRRPGRAGEAVAGLPGSPGCMSWT